MLAAPVAKEQKVNAHMSDLSRVGKVSGFCLPYYIKSSKRFQWRRHKANKG